MGPPPVRPPAAPRPPQRPDALLVFVGVAALCVVALVLLAMVASSGATGGGGSTGGPAGFSAGAGAARDGARGSESAARLPEGAPALPGASEPAPSASELAERPSETPAAAAPQPIDEHNAPDALADGPPPPREFATIRPLGDMESEPAAPWGGAGRSSDFFGARAAGKRFVYVVDASASMRGGAFEEACAELRRSVAELTPTQSFCVFFFNNGYRATPRRAGRAFWKADKQSVAALSEWAEGVVPDGGTDPGAALLDALQLKPDAVFFLTDGGFETEIAATVAEANRERIPIHTIAFGPNAADDLLERMATESGGRFRKVAPAR